MNTQLPAKPRAGFAQTARAVLWSFFGVRRRLDYEKDAAALNPVYVIVIVIGVVAAALFVIVLIVIVNLVVR